MINQRVLAKQLRQRGCTVHVANHGLEALDFIKTTKFWPDNNGTGKNLTAILMDWEMPVCDGLTATRRLREMQVEETVTEHLTVIAITANVRPEQVETTYKAGVVSISELNRMRNLLSLVYSRMICSPNLLPLIKS